MTGRLLPHDRDCGLGDNDDAEEIGFDLCAKIGQARILNRADITIAGIIDEYVQPPKGFNGGPNGITRRTLISHVEGNGANLFTVAPHEIGELRRITRGGNELVTSSKNGFGECSA